MLDFFRLCRHHLAELLAFFSVLFSLNFCERWLWCAPEARWLLQGSFGFRLSAFAVPHIALLILSAVACWLVIVVWKLVVTRCWRCGVREHAPGHASRHCKLLHFATCMQLQSAELWPVGLNILHPTWPTF